MTTGKVATDNSTGHSSSNAALLPICSSRPFLLHVRARSVFFVLHCRSQSELRCTAQARSSAAALSLRKAV
ncbi:hypothetical protein PGIGA_G00094640 [Pangasianodon gigas]|uniref:Uncharacterized protein n=1 Tax=Pangasianodon gigas TaxID=30993 RepID=A0ACC5XF16_PANGG|nr:hypothetical protein [Pangasianodon gigas]